MIKCNKGRSLRFFADKNYLRDIHLQSLLHCLREEMMSCTGLFFNMSLYSFKSFGANVVFNFTRLFRCGYGIYSKTY